MSHAATGRAAARPRSRRPQHDLAELASFWSVTPAPGGGSNVRLRIVARSGLPIPAFVERRIVEQSARRSVDDLVRALSLVAALPEHATR
jgi:hypothetical protein